MLFKRNIFKRYLYRRWMRRPFNTIFDLLIIGGGAIILNILLDSNSSGDSLEALVKDLITAMLFIMSFAIWYAIIFTIRSFLIERKFQYYGFKSAEVNEFQLKINVKIYRSISTTERIDKIDYSKVKSLTVLMDKLTKRRFLRIETDSFHRKDKTYSTVIDSTMCQYDRPETYKQNYENKKLLIPLCMTEDERFIDEIKRRCKKVDELRMESVFKLPN